MDSTSLTLTIVSLTISVMALIAAGLAAWWTRRQGTRTFRIEGRVGMLGGGGVVSHNRIPDAGDVARMAAQGFDRPVIGVRVINTGALPVIVDKWEAIVRGVSFHPLGSAIGPALPHTVPAGGSQDWWTPSDPVIAASSIMKRIQPGRSDAITVMVTFGDGQIRASKPLQGH